MQTENDSGKVGYMVRVGDKVDGPFTLGKLRGMILSGAIPESADVSGGEAEGWRPLQDLYDRMFPSWR